ncbi:MAG: SRPBCC domain-containing protein [Dehalococcoidia bacterium]
MAREFDSEIEIAAPPARVWQVLTDFASFPEWNPFVVKASGIPKEGEPIAVSIKPAGRPAMSFRPTVLKAEPERELRWRGVMGTAALVAGEHFFRIEPSGDGASRFIHGESFSGALAPLVMAFLGNGFDRSFDAMNQALKERAEAPTS